MQVLVSDYDGTFDTNENDIKINCEKIEEFIKNGNLFVLSSGRSFENLSGKVKEYNIPYSFLSCSDGSFLFDNHGIMHYAGLISHDVVNICSKLEELNRHKKFEYTYPKVYSSDYHRFELLGSVAFTIEEDKINNEFVKTFEEIKNSHPEYQYDVYGYKGTYFYLIRPIGVSKSTPIEYIEEKYDISKSDIYTIGDNVNDKELIRDYNGYRIGNNKDIIDVSLKEYNAVHELISDIQNKKVLKRFY